MRDVILVVMISLCLFSAGCVEKIPEEAVDPNGDDDQDGLPNGWELEQGLDPNNGQDAPNCMGAVEYCLRAYDNFTFAETHNSFATSDDGVYYPASNHDTGLDAQWNGGIRAFMLDTHHRSDTETDQDDIAFCHGSNDALIHPCLYSEVDAFVWLEQLRTFMDSDSNQIVTLLLENYVPSSHLEYLFNQTGMLERAYVHQIGDTWPTLGEMILSNRTLVIFWDGSDDSSYPWLHHAWTHSWDTPYGESDESEMSCQVGRGNGDQPVWHLNNWLSNAFGLSDPLRAESVNNYESLRQRALGCWEEVGNRPTFIAVDWWEDGDVVSVVESLNSVTHWST